MPAKEQPIAQTGFLDNPYAQTIYADAASGFFVFNGVIHVTFEAVKVNHGSDPGPMTRVVVGRVAMSVSGAQALAAGLYDFLKNQGLDPVPVPEQSKLN